MIRQALIAAVSALTMAACSSHSAVDDVADGIAAARQSGDFTAVTAMADSVAAAPDDLSIDELANLAVAYVAITNNAVALDSADMADDAMRNFTRLYDTMMERDSAKAIKAIGNIADRNSRVDLTAIDSAYTRALQQLETLKKLSSNQCHSSK